MTYVAGGLIQASDFNTFANSMNEVYADLHSGATTIGAGADFGYGMVPAITGVSAGQTVTANDWSYLFTTMRLSGTHQGTGVTPPVPASGPAAGDIITAFNAPATMPAVVASLQTNRHNLAAGQSTLVVGTNYVQTGATLPWTNSLSFTYQVNFGSWNNARYFFNSGGSLNLSGSYSPVSTPDDTVWATILANMSPLVFNWNSTTPASAGGGTAIGFYGLTTGYQVIYNHAFGGGGYYSNSHVQLLAKYTNAPGTDGLIDFVVQMIDLDVTPFPPPKNGTTTFRIDNLRSSGAVTYPGTVTISPIGGSNGYTSA